nr:hypothetical protein BaRGS_029638 [Batillaria attramentaria]
MLEFTDVERLDTMPSPRIMNSHLSLKYLSEEIVTKKIPVVHMLRNPKDTVVSFHHHRQQMKDVKEQSFTEFAEEFLKGGITPGSYRDYFCYLPDMEKWQKAHPDVPLINMYFEDLKKNPVGSVQKLAEFLKLDVPQTLCADIAEACSFSKLKKVDESFKEGNPAKHLFKGDNPKLYRKGECSNKLEVRKKKKTALNTSRTRRAKAKAQEEYTAADREVKRSTRKDKRDYIDNLANQAEEAAGQGNLKDLYQVTKKLAGKFQQTDKPVKDKNGHPLTTTEEQLKRWAEHFRELLNRPIPETPPDIPPAETELPINCDKPSKAEIRKAIMTLRNGKAAGPDEIPAEAIKADTETAVNMLHSLFSKIWEKEEVPAQWKEGIVIKLPKKGDLRDCSNYRGIMLLSVPGKVLNRILLERMREAVDPMLRDQQAGFRRNRSCADQIASLRIIVEQSLEWNSPLYINFIDYEKAFDSVDREALWKLLRHYGVPGKIISLIQCTYKDMSCRIAHAGQLSESFEVKTGVRQGCLLSPFLFLLVIDWIMKTTTTGRKNGIQWTLWAQLDDLDFADDLALLSHSHSQMQDKTTCLEATSAGTGLKINRRKTELMKINTTANTPVTVGGEPIREVESFVYLGSVVDGQGGTDRDVTARIGKARAAMVMLKNIWASKVVSIRTKLRIFNSNVKSVLLYGCETWRTTKTMQQKIQTFLNTCLRRIFNIRWPEKIRNEELWERAGQEPAAKQILRRKWGWIGHTLRKPASSTTRQALTWNPQGKRKRGRPRNSWRRDTEAELYKQGTNWTGVARIAQNRVRWRRVVDGLCSTWSQGPKSRRADQFRVSAEAHFKSGSASVMTFKRNLKTHLFSQF